MAIFIISRRPLPPFNERAWSYINHFTSDNAAVQGEARRDGAYAALRRRAESMAHSWRVAEPEAEFRVMDSGVNNTSDKFDQPAEVAPVDDDEVDEPPPPVVTYDCDPIAEWRMDAADVEPAVAFNSAGMPHAEDCGCRSCHGRRLAS